MGGAEKTPNVSEKVLGVAAANVLLPRLFEFMLPECKPVAIRSRQYSKDDREFIQAEVEKLLAQDIIEHSRSPWRAQVLVVRGDTKKDRTVVDYSQTVNRFTQLDAYPLPNIEEVVNNVAQDKFYSSVDLRSAYYQVPLREDERPYTAFKAMGKLYQYKRLPSGVTNVVSAFPRVIGYFIRRNKLKKVYAYLDDLTVTGQQWKSMIKFFKLCWKLRGVTISLSMKKNLNLVWKASICWATKYLMVKVDLTPGVFSPF